MAETIIPILFGWPTILLALLLAWVGMLSQKAWLLGASALISIPFAVYLYGSPGTRWAGPAIPLGLLLAGLTMRSNRLWVGWLVTALFTVLLTWLAAVVMSQPG